MTDIEFLHPEIYDDDDIELERQLDLRRCAADLLLVERAREWTLGEWSLILRDNDLPSPL